LDKVHRRDLKHDRFVEQVGHTVEYAEHHKSQMILWGSIGLAVIVAAFGVYLYMSHAGTVRAEDLSAAMKVQDAQIGPANASAYVLSFPTPADKNAAVAKALTEVMNRYPSKREGLIARFYLGVQYADQGKLAEAENTWKVVAESGDKEYASQAKLSLAQLYEVQGRYADGEKLLRPLIENPTIMVSKEQATIALAHLLSHTQVDQARKLLEPLRTERSAVSRMALTALGELPQK
jgi:predicted negative regulator of RcsB-dependent stress response